MIDDVTSKKVGDVNQPVNGHQRGVRKPKEAPGKAKTQMARVMIEGPGNYPLLEKRLKTRKSENGGRIHALRNIISKFQGRRIYLMGTVKDGDGKSAAGVPEGTGVGKIKTHQHVRKGTRNEGRIFPNGRIVWGGSQYACGSGGRL